MHVHVKYESGGFCSKLIKNPTMVSSGLTNIPISTIMSASPDPTVGAVESSRNRIPIIKDNIM
jgi:hypothetical protein